MAEVTLTIGDRAHVVACRDGEEAQFRHLGTLLDERWEVASRASGNMGNERTMLFVALMLADALDEARRQPPGDSGVDDASLDRVAEKLEALAKIGRASCRERVCQYVSISVVAGALQKKKKTTKNQKEK